MTDLLRSIAVKPIIKYPREAQVGKTYLMTIDLLPEEGFEWQYEEEEYPIYCTVDSDLFSSKPVGEPTIVLHRYGGSYGEAKFLLRAEKENQGDIRISLINAWGVLIKSLKLEPIQVKPKGETLLEMVEESLITISTSFNPKAVEVVVSQSHEKLSVEDSEVSEAPALILTAISVEYRAVRSYLRDIQEVTFQGVMYEQGKFIANGKLREVVIGEVGTGGIRAAVATYQAINHFKPNVLLFVGVAGGIKDVELGDVIAVTKAYNYESGKVEGEFKPRPSIGLTSYRLYEQARREAQKTDWLQRLATSSHPIPRVHVAPVASGDKVIASRQSSVFELLRSHYADAIAVDMESYGVLEAANTYPEVDKLIIRGIADLMDDQKMVSASYYREIAALHASAFAFEILAKFLGNKSSTSKSASANVSTLFNRFIRNIQPSKEDVAEANRQTSQIVERLKNKKAVNEQFRIEKVLRAGSYAKLTALRRVGNNGSDADIVAYFTGKEATKRNFSKLKDFICEQLRDIYPTQAQENLSTLRGNVRLRFSSGLIVDVVPVIKEDTLEVENGGWFPSYGGQYRNGWQLTSVTCHKQFITSRTAKSKEMSELVRFNKLVQLVKWWNNQQKQLRQPSILCELITAAAFDKYGVTDEWQSSLRQVFSFLLENKFLEPIVFGDFYDVEQLDMPPNRVIILDPANAENNFARNWTERTRLAYLERIRIAHDAMVEAQNHELDGDDENATAMWCKVFGDTFRFLSRRN
jgi:nucleoside phosphorylase